MDKLKKEIELLKQQNKYLTEQNKAFQEQYNESGTIIRNLRQQNKELLKFISDIAYNDINKNDLNIDWVQKESWELLKKYE